MSSMEMLRLFQILSGSTHQADHTLYLIFGWGSLGSSCWDGTAMVWPLCPENPAGYYAPFPSHKAMSQFCLTTETNGSNWLPELSAGTDALQQLIRWAERGWNTSLSEAIDKIAPHNPLHPRKRSSPGTVELRGMKWELRRLEQIWQRTRNKATRTAYRTFMKSYELMVKLFSIHHVRKLSPSTIVYGNSLTNFSHWENSNW